MNLPHVIIEKLDAITDLCDRFGVRRLYVFGSVVTDTFDPMQSDLDFVVQMTDLPPIERGEMLLGLWESLENLFDKKVDLLTDQPISNPYLRASIERTKRLVYDRQSKKVLS